MWPRVNLSESNKIDEAGSEKILIIKESFRIIVHVSFGLPLFLRPPGVHLRATCGNAADGMPCPSNSSSSTTSHLSQNTVDPQDKQKGVDNTPLFHTYGHAEGVCKRCVADDLGLEVAERIGSI